MPQSRQTYEQAYDELAIILTEIENGKVTIDQLMPKIKRAKELYEFCRAQLKKVSSDVNTLLENE